jgi:hypothetical protein
MFSSPTFHPAIIGPGWQGKADEELSGIEWICCIGFEKGSLNEWGPGGVDRRLMDCDGMRRELFGGRRRIAAAELLLNCPPPPVAEMDSIHSHQQQSTAGGCHDRLGIGYWFRASAAEQRKQTHNNGMEWAQGKEGNAKANNYLLLPCPDSKLLDNFVKPGAIAKRDETYTNRFLSSS